MSSTTLLHLGTDLDASVHVGDVIFSSICAAVAISAVLAWRGPTRLPWPRPKPAGHKWPVR